MRYFAVVMTLAVMLAGCATAAPSGSAVDVSGPWTGTWEGFGVAKIKRNDTASAQFTQRGDHGSGRLWLDGTLASESVPQAMRLAGLAGIPVIYDVRGNRVTMFHELDEKLLKGDFVVNGERMVGTLSSIDMYDSGLPQRVILNRVPPKVAAAPPPPAPTPPTPAPAAPPAPAPPVATAPLPPPAPARPAPQEFSPTDALKPVYFEFDRADIRPADTATLEANVRWLQDNRDALVIVEGHCDERGTNAYNLALGERRARTVRDFLVSRGVAADRITTVSYGEERPVCSEKTEDCWAKNRRAAFVVKPK